MEFGLFVLGAIVGWGVAFAFDVLYYRQSSSFTKTLDAAQARIDMLQNELTTLRAQEAERGASPPLFLVTDEADGAREPHDDLPRLESQNADHARVAELEGRLEELRRESAEADRRARLFEARLIDASSELASLRYGLPTLDRKAEDELADAEGRGSELESPLA